MGEPLAIQFVVQVGVSVKMEDCQVRPPGTIALEDGVGDRVVAAQSDQRMSQAQRAPDGGFNRGESRNGTLGKIKVAGVVQRAATAQVGAVFGPQIA